MPAAQFGGEFLHPTLRAMATAYLFHVCKNHAFVDGNKRAAMAAAEMFVRLNGAKLKASNRELETLTLGGSDGSLSKDQAIDFFEKHVVSSP